MFRDVFSAGGWLFVGLRSPVDTFSSMKSIRKKKKKRNDVMLYLNPSPLSNENNNNKYHYGIS